MDLGGWNFDPGFMNSLNWNENNNETTSRNNEGSKDKKSNDAKSTSSSASSPPKLDVTSWDGNLALLSSFGGIEYEGGVPSQKSEASISSRNNIDATSSTGEAASLPNPSSLDGSAGAQSRTSQDKVATVSEAPSFVSTIKTDATSSVASGGTSSQGGQLQDVGGSQLHPLAIQSSAVCPTHNTNNSVARVGREVQPNPYVQLAATGLVPGQHQPPPNLFGLSGLDGASIASLAASYQQPNVATMNSNIASNLHLKSLAANFVLAHGDARSRGSSHPASSSITSATTQNQSTTTGSSGRSGSSDSSSSTRRNQQQQVVRTANNTRNSNSDKKAPPFYLFDAPVELRANFMQNQRRLGLPIQHDPNSYHYGETVKGFHPQQLLNQQQVHRIAADGSVKHMPPAPVKLIDARHDNSNGTQSGRVKNEREQKRAQKITELIDQLRVHMEGGGWKVEIRSKFHTLSQCAAYVKHMIQTMKEKEEAVKRLKSDLEVKQRKVEEDKAAQESRSDPESVTSSLTSDTTGSHSHSKSESSDNNDGQKPEGNVVQRKAPNRHGGNAVRHHMSSLSTNEDSSGAGEDQGSGGSGSGSGEPSARTGISSYSDLTDSNRASSSNNSGSNSGSGNTNSMSPMSANDADDEGQPSTSSISSDAAVASEKSSRDRHSGRHHHQHKDVVFNKEKRSDRKRPPEEVTSLERNFELNFEEVFLSSNLPQLIATSSGKIVTWNHCFLKATGLRKSELNRMTIFSLVKPENLTNFFEIAAQALRPHEKEQGDAAAVSDEGKTSDDMDVDKETTTQTESDTATDSTKTLPQRETDYTGVTLPCVEFPAMKRRRDASEAKDKSQMKVTVTLLGNEDPRKQCFHCVFTNYPGVNGSLGLITPDILASLSQQGQHISKKLKRHHHHRRHLRPLPAQTRVRNEETNYREETSVTSGLPTDSAPGEPMSDAPKLSQ